MALTITIEGLGELDNAESTTNWGVAGSGGSSISLDTEIFYQGSSSINSKFSSGKQGWVYYNHGSPLNFTTTYSGQYILIWFQITTPGSASVINGAQQGISFRCGTNTSNYREWRLGGSDTFANGYTGGWQCAVIDPTTSGTNDVGTYSATSVQYMGIHYDGNTASRAENVFVDSVMVGKGIRITGTETTSGAGWQEVVDYCTDRENRAWGFIQEKEAGIFTVYGTLYVGSSTQTATTTLTDSARIFKFGNYEYYNNTSTPTTASSISNGFHGLVVEDAASFATTFQDGIIVGTDGGRSGSTFIGASGANTTFDLYGGNNSSSTTKLYGSTLNGIDGGITWGNDAGHHMYACTITKSAQFDPVGAVKIRNTVFSETSDVDAALLWNSNIDVQDSSFIANTIGAGYEYTDAGSYAQTDLTYSGNTYDILYSAATSSGQLTISATDSNPSTSEITNATGNSVSILNSVNINITVKDANNVAIQNAAVAVYRTSDDVELMNELSNASGLASESYNYLSDTDVYIRVRKSSTGTRYYPVKTTGVILNNGLTLTVILNKDGIVS